MDQSTSGPRAKVPAFTSKYYPAQGGWEGGSIEAEGSPGDKEVGQGGMSKPTGNTTEGDYASTVGTIGTYPHGTEDPALSGPPLGATVGPDGDIDLGDRSPGGGEGNEPRKHEVEPVKI